MPTPFPGMDPYLERPELWPDVHNALIAELRLILGETLRPRYVVCLEERTYLDPEGLVFIGRPDLLVRATQRDRPPAATEVPRPAQQVLEVEVPVPDRVRESYLEVRSVGSGEVITVLELLSPGNKRPGRGRAAYQEKRETVIETRTNLVEIDLLRDGEPMPIRGGGVVSDYRFLISRGDRRPRAELVVFSVRHPLPAALLPLRADEVGPEIRLRAALDRIYDAAAYDLRVDYRGEPTPPLAPADAAWADDMLRAAGLRGR